MPPKASVGPREPPNPGSTASASAASAGPAAGNERNKVVLRRLPATLPEAVFWSSVEPWISDADVDWKAYKSGRSTQTGPNSKENVNSVAYIHFKRQDLVTKFAAAYNGHVFRDSKGQISRVSVEYAPFQKTPAKRQKPDAILGTIDDDPDYLAFVASLNAPAEPKPVADSVSTKAPVNKSTPLLEALRQQKKLAKEKKLNSKGKAPEKPANAPDVTKMTRAERRAYLKHLKKEELAAASNDSKGKNPESSTTGKKKGLRIKGTESTAPLASTPAPSTYREAGKSVQAHQQSSTATAKQQAHKTAQKATEEAKPAPKMTILPKPLLSPASGTSARQEPTKTKQVPTNSAPTSPPAKTKPSGNFDDIVGQFAMQMSFGGKAAQSATQKEGKEVVKPSGATVSEVNPVAAGRGRGGPGPRGGRGSDTSFRGRGQARGVIAIKSAHPGNAAPSGNVPAALDAQPKNDSSPQSVPTALRGRGRGAGFGDRGRGTPRGGFRGGRGVSNGSAPPTTQLPT